MPHLTRDTDDVVTTILQKIDDAGDPSQMSKREWLEFLEAIICECESRLSAVRGELEDDDE
jgi:hypothetical protein